MTPRRRTVDRWFLGAVITLAVVGFFIFISASLGLLVQEDVSYADVVFNQFFLGFVGGFIALAVTASVHYRFWRRWAFYLFLASIILTLLVFVPGLGVSHGGATRWLDLWFTTFQPAEALKIGFIIYFAAWISGVKNKLHTWSYGLVPLLILLAIMGGLLLAQPDTDTFVIIAATGLSMFFVAGARWHHILIVILLGLVTFAGIVVARPYVQDRVMTYLNPNQNPLTESYQIQQSLIAIGSGQVFGRGFGQSIQKFNYLPEPIGDSIFAVAAEEFGFVGSLVIICLYLFFIYRGLFIAVRAPDVFARLTVTGIVILIGIQSIMNIAAMVGLVPLSGMPLLFISHGGSALAVTLAEVGIILNISKYMKSKTRMAS